MLQYSPSELQSHLTQQKPVLIDVREQWEYDLCHIEGSLLYPMNEMPERMKELNPSDQFVVICHHGFRSYQVAMFLESNGFTDLINLEGGIDGWAKEVDSSMATY